MPQKPVNNSVERCTLQLLLNTRELVTPAHNSPSLDRSNVDTYSQELRDGPFLGIAQDRSNEAVQLAPACLPFPPAVTHEDTTPDVVPVPSVMAAAANDVSAPPSSAERVALACRERASWREQAGRAVTPKPPPDDPALPPARYPTKLKARYPKNSSAVPTSQPPTYQAAVKQEGVNRKPQPGPSKAWREQRNRVQQSLGPPLRCEEFTVRKMASLSATPTADNEATTQTNDELAAEFNKLDAKQVGALDLEALRQAVSSQQLDFDDRDLEQAMQAAGSSSSGAVDLSQYITLRTRGEFGSAGSKTGVWAALLTLNLEVRLRAAGDEVLSPATRMSLQANKTLCR